MDLGFTGTRNGMTGYQHIKIIELLNDMDPGRAHHGDCIGADQEFHDMCRERGWWMVGHPPVDQSLVANCVFDELNPRLPYITRNHKIVDSVELMIAAPPTMVEMYHGGTWKTILYARKKSTPMWVVYPDGKVVREGRF